MFPGLLNTIGTLLDRSRTILQKVKKSRKWGQQISQMGAPWAPGGPWARAPGTLGPKNKEIMKMGGFFEHGKDARRNSVPGTVLNNSKSLIWSQTKAKTTIEQVSINCVLC